MTRRLGVVAIALMSLVVSPTAAAAASTPSPLTPSCVVKIIALRFHPPRVAPGGSSVVRLDARNCTRQTRNATLTWFGRFVGVSPGIPSGCPAIDPVAQRVTVTPHGRLTASLGFVVFSSCTATALSETAQLTGADGTILAAKTANLLIT